MVTRRSLGGAEQRGGRAGVGSSPTVSTNKKVLRRMLRARDRKITELSKWGWWNRKKMEEKTRLDKERKDIRLRIKKYEANTFSK